MLVFEIFGTSPRVGVSPSGVDHDGGRGVFGRHGATQDQPGGDLGRSGRESAVAMEGFCRNAVGRPEWECEAMCSVVWVQCATSAECINLSIVEYMVTDALESRSHHGSTFNEFCTLGMKFALWWWQKGHHVELDQMWSWL